MLIPRYANSILDHTPNLRFGFRVTAALAQAFGVIHARQQRHRMIRTECCGFAIDQCAELCECLLMPAAVEKNARIALRDSYAGAVPAARSEEPRPGEAGCSTDRSRCL